MKRIISVILCMLIALSAGPLSACAYYYDIKTEGDFEYVNHRSYGVTVTEYTGNETEVVIPEKLGGKPVIAIGDYAFYSDSITSVTLPESVTIIGQEAFSYLKKLSSINLEHIECIGPCAFSGTSLESVSLNSAKTIYYGAFWGCQSLKSVSLPDSLRKINNSVFSGCYALETVNLENLEVIGAYAFCNNKALKSINLKSIKEIQRGAFQGCESLNGITLGGSLTHIEKEAFKNTQPYKTAIDENDNAFYIGKCLINAFTDRKEGKFKVKNGTVLIADSAFSNTSYKNKELTASVYVPDSVYYIGSEAFSAKSIKKIRLPEKLKKLGVNAFTKKFIKKHSKTKNGCTYIGNVLISCDKKAFSISIKKGTVLIADGALSNALYTKLVIPSGVKYIGEDAVFRCQRLRSVSIPKSVSVIWEGNFVNSGTRVDGTCKKLTKITVNKNSKYYSSKGGVLYNKKKTELIAYPVGNKRKSFTVPSSVKTIKKDAFAFSPYLSEIKLNSSLERVGETAFKNCRRLKSVTIPESVKEIGYCAFGHCYYSDENEGGYHTEQDFTVYGKKGSEAERFCKEIVYITDYEDEGDFIAAPLKFTEV